MAERWNVRQSSDLVCALCKVYIMTQHSAISQLRVGSGDSTQCKTFRPSSVAMHKVCMRQYKL